MTTLSVRRLDPGAELPTRAHAGDAGLDLRSIENVLIEPGARALVGTGIAVEIPEGYAGLVCPRSGLAVKHGIGVVNGPGVIDAGYRGELKVALYNSDQDQAFRVEAGMRIAQLLLVPVMLATVAEVAELSEASRSGAGFGSTGVR